jgi:hypothetical protein
LGAVIHAFIPTEGVRDGVGAKRVGAFGADNQTAIAAVFNVDIVLGALRCRLTTNHVKIARDAGLSHADHNRV